MPELEGTIAGGGSDLVLCGWENERRGDIANVTNQVRVKAGIGTQGFSPGPLNQEPLHREDETTCVDRAIPGPSALPCFFGTGAAV